MITSDRGPETSPKSTLRGCGCLTVIAVAVIGGCVAIFHDSPTTPNAPRHASRANRHAQREQAVAAASAAHEQRAKYRDYWHKAIYALAFSSETLDVAKASIAQGDLPDASRMLEQGQKYAGDALNDAQTDVPGGWGDVATGLEGSAQDFSSALGHMRDYMDSNKPSDAAAALDANDQAKSELEAATHAARVSYESMGGAASDLDDVQTAQQSVDSAVKALAGASGGDSQ